MARGRHPGSFVVWALVLLRSLVVLLLFGCLGVLIHISVKFKRNLSIAYSMVGVILLWDLLILIRTYFRRSINPTKLEAVCNIIIEVCVLVAAFFGGLGTLLISGYSHQCNGNPECDPSLRPKDQDLEVVVVYMLFAVGAIHFFIFILTCIECCTARKAARRLPS